MKKEDKSFELHGTNKEQAKQLYDIIKQGSISTDVLNDILPYEAEFFKALVETIRIESDKEVKEYELYVKTTTNNINNLINLVPNDNLDVETRCEILRLISKMSEDLSKAQTAKTKEEEITKRWYWGICVFGAVAIASVLIRALSNKSGGNTNNIIH